MTDRGEAGGGHRLGRRCLRSVATGVAWLMVMLFAGDGVVRAQARLDEYQVKAAYLYNFAKLVQWPDTAFSGPQSPLIIGVYGSDPFGTVLDELIRNKRSGNRPLEVRRSVRMQDLRNSHIIFVGESPEPVAAALSQLAGSTALTVGQSSRFLADGGMVLFQIENGRVVFTIDPAAASRARLSINAHLLHLARLSSPARP